MKLIRTKIEDLIIFEPTVLEMIGLFSESYNKKFEEIVGEVCSR